METKMETKKLKNTQKRKQKRQAKIRVLRDTTRYLMSSGNFKPYEARQIAKEAAFVAKLARPPIPVRITELQYPQQFISSTSTDEYRFQQVKEFLSESIERRNGPPIVAFLRVSGYIMVLTENWEGEQCVRSLMGEMWNRGIRLREPTIEEVNKFREKRYLTGTLKLKPSRRYTKEAKHWKEFLTGQPIEDSETEESDSDCDE